MKPSVLVTGGVRRIGRGICEKLARSGWHVIIHSRNENDAEAISLSVDLNASRTWGDLNDEQEVNSLFDRALESAENLSAVVNNASLFSVAGFLPDDEKKKLMMVNHTSPCLLSRKLFESLLERGSSGSIVNLLDTRVLSSSYDRTPYAESKRALLESTWNDAKKYAPVLRVNAVAPGPVLIPSDASSSEKGGQILLSSRPSVDDIANAVNFLLTAPSVTGGIIAVDSGQHLIAHEIQR
jgi:NAD(P)-dependent dehydrogenase (short-subunit alcohol dehydrogenase family)